MLHFIFKTLGCLLFFFFLITYKFDQTDVMCVVFVFYALAAANPSGMNTTVYSQTNSVTTMLLNQAAAAIAQQLSAKTAAPADLLMAGAGAGLSSSATANPMAAATAAAAAAAAAIQQQFQSAQAKATASVAGLSLPANVPVASVVAAAASASVPPITLPLPLPMQPPTTSGLMAAQSAAAAAAAAAVASKELTENQKKLLGMSSVEDPSASLEQQTDITLKGKEQRLILMQKLMQRRADPRILVLRNMVGPEDVDADLESEITGMQIHILLTHVALSIQDDNRYEI